MKIFLDQIETAQRINALQLKTNFLATYCKELYYDTELCKYVIIFPDNPGNKVSGTVFIEPTHVKAAHVAAEVIPKHQPVGTPESHDTPSGQKKKGSVEKAKSVLAERIEARKASTEE